MKCFRFLTLAFLLLFILTLSNEGKAVNGIDDQELLRKILPKIFIDCNYCDMEYVRTNMTFVNYVRDTKEAEIYILITRLRTGSGGREYTLEFSGQGKFKGKNDKLIYISKKEDTEDEIRSGLLKSLKLGIIQYIKNTELSKYIEISFEKNIDLGKTVDPWNKWVFNFDIGAWINGEESYKSSRFSYSLSADRVTSGSRISIKAYMSDYQNSYLIDNEKIESKRKIKQFRALWIGGLGSHWSIGGKFLLYSSTYINKKFERNLSPMIEYNVFPYSEATKKQFRFIYSLNLSRANYFEETIFGKMSEYLFSQQLSVAAEIKEKWGSIDSSVLFSNFFHDLKKFTAEFEGSVNWRIVKGLSFELSGGYSIIHNQLYLPKGDLTTEEILLRTSAIETSYYYWASFGLRVTFGSIYNNVVNPRFGY